MKYSTVESEYLVLMLKAALKEEPVAPAPESLDWSKLIALSKKQQVYSMLVPVVNYSLLGQENSDNFKLYTQNELIRILAVRNELDEIKAQLLENQIDFMLLKGSVIRQYYPMEKMRQMSDIDLLYKEKDREKLIKLMKSRGYYLSAAEANSDDFYKNPYYSFEFHREIFDEVDEFHPNFDLWKKAVQDEENSCEYHISREDLFIYSLCHMYDHYSISGCGIRFVCDIYVLLNSFDKLDWDYINSTIDAFGFRAFCDTAIQLARALFDDAVSGDKEQELLDFIMSAGVYGKAVDYKKIIDEQFKGSKFRYIMHRIFPPKKQMFGNYVELQKWPFLLPFFYMKRLFEKFSYHKKLMITELKNIRKI